MSMTYKYIAVTHPWQWRCAECGSDALPTYSSFHAAVVQKSGVANLFGPKVAPQLDGNQMIDSVEPTPKEMFLECNDCGEEYEASPAEASLAEMIRREGVEELELTFDDFVHIHQFVPGEDGNLYGAMDPHRSFYPRNSLWGIGAKKHKQGVQLRLKKDKLIWSFDEGIVLDSYRFSDELIERMTRPLRITAGKEEMKVHENFEVMVNNSLVTWMREDLIEAEGNVNWRSVKSKLLTYHDTVNWWRIQNIYHIDIPNLQKVGVAFPPIPGPEEYFKGFNPNK